LSLRARPCLSLRGALATKQSYLGQTVQSLTKCFLDIIDNLSFKIQ